MKIKQKIRFLFDDLSTPEGKTTDLFVITLIILACSVYVAQTYTFTAATQNNLKTIEIIIGILFTIEYLLRLWVANNRVKHAFQVYSIIDLVAILPVFIAFSNLQFLRISRVFRIFRLLRFLKHRYFFFGEITETMLIGTRLLFTVLTIIFIASGMMLVAEKAHNPNIQTFMDATYFSIVTLTTVGFGDIVPLTQTGRLITLLIILSGIIFIPWQLGSLIRQLIATTGKTNVICKQCGLTHHDKDAIHCKHCGTIIYQKTIGTK